MSVTVSGSIFEDNLMSLVDIVYDNSNEIGYYITHYIG